MIERIDGPLALPLSTDDYVAQNNLTATSFLGLDRVIPVVGGQIPIGAIFQIGGTVYLCTAAENITGGASAYVKITPAVGGATCTASYVANLTGVTWDSAYNGWYDVGGNLYVFDEGRALDAGEIAAVHSKNLQVDEDGGAALMGPLRLGGGIEDDGGTVFKTKIIAIGDWNMDTTDEIHIDYVALGLTPETIISFDAYIHNDSDEGTRRGYRLDYFDDTLVKPAGSCRIHGTEIWLTRLTNGVFDSAAYNMTTYNRGFLVIRHIA